MVELQAPHENIIEPAHITSLRPSRFRLRLHCSYLIIRVRLNPDVAVTHEYIFQYLQKLAVNCSQ